MNIFQKLKLLFQFKGMIETEIQEAKKMNSVGKPGWKTTEFYFNLAAQIGTMWGAVQGFIPPKYAAIISIIGASVYTLARTISKAVTDVQNVRAAQVAAIQTGTVQ